MLLSAVSVLVVAHSISEIPEGLMNNPEFVVFVRRNVRQADCRMPYVMFLRDKDEIKYLNYFVSILFTLKCHVIPYELTHLFPDDVECTNLT